MAQHPPTRPASAQRWREFAHRGVLALLLAAPLSAQGLLDDAAVRLLATEAVKLVGSDEAVVRGEAALVLAATKEPRLHDLVLAVAKDKDSEARLRGLLALGVLGTPGSERVLEDALLESAMRVRPEGVVAAYALGNLPADAAPACVGRFLAHVLRSNYKRQHDVLSAMLVALLREPHPVQAPALIRLLDDAANRDASLRGELVLALGRADDAVDSERLQRLLEQGAEPERRAALQVLLTQEPDDKKDGDPWQSLICRLQAHDPSPEVRAAALAYLTKVRYLPALDLAAASIKSTQPVEVEQGVRSALKLGGGGMRRAVAEHILSSERPKLQAAMLRAYDAAADRDFALSCRALAADRKKPTELRAAAALVAARTLGEEAAPVLRDLAAADLDTDTLVSILRALLLAQPDAPALETLFPPDRGDLAQMPHHLQALLLARHPHTLRFLLQRLGATDTLPATKACMLRAIRQALAPPPARELLDMLPEPIRGLLR